MRTCRRTSAAPCRSGIVRPLPSGETVTFAPHALWRSGGVSHGHRRDTRSVGLARARCQSQPLIQPNIGRRPARKCLESALRAAAVNARRTGTRVTTNMRSGVDGGEHSAMLDGVMAGGLTPRGHYAAWSADRCRCGLRHHHAQDAAHIGGAHRRQHRSLLTHLSRSTP
jgi:hypothetical protein